MTVHQRLGVAAVVGTLRCYPGGPGPLDPRPRAVPVLGGTRAPGPRPAYVTISQGHVTAADHTGEVLFQGVQGPRNNALALAAAMTAGGDAGVVLRAPNGLELDPTAPLPRPLPLTLPVTGP